MLPVDTLLQVLNEVLPFFRLISALVCILHALCAAVFKKVGDGDGRPLVGDAVVALLAVEVLRGVY